MKILVVGGTGVVTEGLIPALLKHKHDVTVVSRHAVGEQETWRNGLSEMLQRDPTPLEKGLRRLVDEMPELVPSPGIGRLKRDFGVNSTVRMEAMRSR